MGYRKWIAVGAGLLLAAGAATAGGLAAAQASGAPPAVVASASSGGEAAPANATQAGAAQPGQADASPDGIAEDGHKDSRVERDTEEVQLEQEHGAADQHEGEQAEIEQEDHLDADQVQDGTQQEGEYSGEFGSGGETAAGTED